MEKLARAWTARRLHLRLQPDRRGARGRECPQHHPAVAGLDLNSDDHRRFATATERHPVTGTSSRSRSPMSASPRSCSEGGQLEADRRCAAAERTRLARFAKTVGPVDEGAIPCRRFRPDVELIGRADQAASVGRGGCGSSTVSASHGQRHFQPRGGRRLTTSRRAPRRRTTTTSTEDVRVDRRRRVGAALVRRPHRGTVRPRDWCIGYRQSRAA